MEPFLLRGLERLAVIAGAITIAYFGYKLYLHGIEKGRGQLKSESKFFSFVLSGTGPGLFFMAFSSIILVMALFTGGSENESIIVSPNKSASKSVREIYIEPIETKELQIEFKPLQASPELDFIKIAPLEPLQLEIQRIRYLSEVKHEVKKESAPNESSTSEPVKE
jgi:hypothetical protein